jgi:hypothetical protein
MPLDGATWARGRGWALWKGLITLAEYTYTNPKANPGCHACKQWLRSLKLC